LQKEFGENCIKRISGVLDMVSKKGTHEIIKTHKTKSDNEFKTSLKFWKLFRVNMNTV